MAAAAATKATASSPRLAGRSPRQQQATGSPALPFDSMNQIVAEVLSDLTSSTRFHGSLDVDLNEITTNLVPFPRMPFLLSARSPLSTAGSSSLAHLPFQPRSPAEIFSTALSPRNQLLASVNPRGSRCLATAYLLRGDITVGTAYRNVSRIKGLLQPTLFSKDAFKIGICAVEAAPDRELSLLALFNSCEMRRPLHDAHRAFTTLYRRRAHLHHYTSMGVDEEYFNCAEESVVGLAEDYATIDASGMPPRAYYCDCHHSQDRRGGGRDEGRHDPRCRAHPAQDDELRRLLQVDDNVFNAELFLQQFRRQSGYANPLR
eukprot:GHVU01023392.1.p1 GENE.GHVU01023392.1~~GHVU01023392.1.p1  ORF type:complete len:340 (+),score=58.04 GHVU01023392.1:67-1020(+)